MKLANRLSKVQMERAKYLNKQQYAVWEDKNGKWCTYLPADATHSHRRLCRRNSHSELDDAIISYWREQEENPTVEQVYCEWIDRRVRLEQIKKSTKMRNDVLFNRYYKDFKSRRIRSITDLEWEDFLCQCVCEYKLTAKGFANLKSVTKGFLKRAKKRGLIDMNVETFFNELDLSDGSYRRRRVVDSKEVYYDDEIAKIFLYIKDHIDSWNLGIALMFATGLRVGELVALQYGDFDGLRIRITKTETHYRDQIGKMIYEIEDGAKTEAGERTVVVPQEMGWIVGLLVPAGSDPTQFVFTNRNGTRMTTNSIRRRLETICQNVGVPYRSPHKIRKTYASILLDNGTDKKLIMEQMGHTDILCTETFYHRDRRRTEEKQRIINSVPEFQNLMTFLSENTTSNQTEEQKTLEIKGE